MRYPSEDRHKRNSGNDHCRFSFTFAIQFKLHKMTQSSPLPLFCVAIGNKRRERDKNATAAVATSMIRREKRCFNASSKLRTHTRTLRVFFAIHISISCCCLAAGVIIIGTIIVPWWWCTRNIF